MLFPTVAAPIYIPTISVRGFPFPHALSSINASSLKAMQLQQSASVPLTVLRLACCEPELHCLWGGGISQWSEGLIWKTQRRAGSSFKQLRQVEETGHWVVGTVE